MFRSEAISEEWLRKCDFILQDKNDKENVVYKEMWFRKSHGEDETDIILYKHDENRFSMRRKSTPRLSIVNIQNVRDLFDAAFFYGIIMLQVTE